MSQTSGWSVTPEGGRFAVRKISNERMRIGADGSLSFGDPEPYWFNTREWAELCKQSMERLDDWEHRRKFGFSTIGSLISAQGHLTSSIGQLTMTRIALQNKPVLVIDHNREVVKFDIPALVMIWLKTTWIPKAWNHLMWGIKGKSK